jgi:hypothetical protein
MCIACKTKFPNDDSFNTHTDLCPCCDKSLILDKSTTNHGVCPNCNYNPAYCRGACPEKNDWSVNSTCRSKKSKPRSRSRLRLRSISRSNRKKSKFTNKEQIITYNPLQQDQFDNRF